MPVIQFVHQNKQIQRSKTDKCGWSDGSGVIKEGWIKGGRVGDLMEGRGEGLGHSTLTLRDELALIVQFTQDVICDLCLMSPAGWCLRLVGLYKC